MSYCKPTKPLEIPQVEKAVGAVLNYGFDLSPTVQQNVSPWAPPGPIPVPWLPAGEAVVVLSVVSDGGTPTGTADIDIVETTITANAAGVPASLLTAWIAGGTAGTVYVVTYSWTTNSNPVQSQDSRSIQLTCVAVR